MANISSAFGQVTIYALSIDDIKRVLEAHEKDQKRVYYETAITNEFLDDRTHAPAVHTTTSGEVYELPGAISVEFDFSGSGRWNFQSNVGWFIDCIFRANPDLKNISFGAVFEFTDAEPGCGFIYNCVMQTHYNPNTGVTTTTLEESDELDYNASNLVEYGFYDEGEVFDREWILDNKEKALEHLRLDAEEATLPEYEAQLSYFVEHPDEFFKLIEEEGEDGVWDSISEYLDNFDSLQELFNTATA